MDMEQKELTYFQKKLIQKLQKKKMSSREIIEQLKKQRDVCKKLKGYDDVFQRGVFKLSVMVTCNYGGSQSTSRQDILQKLKGSKFLEEAEHEELMMFTEMVYWTLGIAVPSAMNFLEYFRKLLRFVLDYNDSVYYDHPMTGFPVHLRQRQVVDSSLQYSVNGKKRKSSIKKILPTTDVRKTVSSTVPGITHSTDAAILMKIKEKTPIPMSYIHDSVGIHPNYIQSTTMSVNETLLEVYNGSIYEKLRDQLLKDIPSDEIPDELLHPPVVGDFNEADDIILNAIYAFS